MSGQNYIFNMNIIADTELILTPKKKIYHLNLSKEQIAEDIILVGDPARVNLVSKKFDTIEHKIKNREFHTHTGWLNGKKISVISTGIGTDNIDIVINELDALVNIDFTTRTVNKERKALNLIRIGTSGALQNDIEIDSIITSSFALGLDGLAHFYLDKKKIEKEISTKFKNHTNWPKKLADPYFIKSSENLLTKFSQTQIGITATAPGFYGPQGRTLRIENSMKEVYKKMTNFCFKNERIVNFEMETSALYYLGRTLGHETITMCAIIGNRKTNRYSRNYKKTINKLIEFVLEKIAE